MVGEYITIPKDNIKARDVKLYVLARTMLFNKNIQIETEDAN